jgi:predicted ATPase
MLHTVAIRGYRSMREVVVPLTGLTVVTGATGTGKVVGVPGAAPAR